MIYPLADLSDLVDDGVVELTRGKVISKTDLKNYPGSYPVYSSASLNDGKFGEYGLFMFDEELITWSVDGGGTFFYRPKHRFSVTNVGGLLRILKPEELDYKYLYYALSIQHSQLNFDWVQKAHPSVIYRLYKSIPLPPLSEQRRIAAIIDKADAIRAKRREAMAQLDKLTQSIFVEMFGDPALNPKSWPVTSLGSFIQSASDGPHVSPKYAEAGVPFLSTRHVRPGEISWTDMKYLSREDAEIQWKKCKPSRDDILYTKGGTTGFAAVVRTDQEFAVWVHVALLKPRKELADPTWLEAMLNHPYCYRQSQELTHGIANRDLGLKRMVKIRMYHPPLALQREFTQRMTKLSNQKNLQKAALIELESLFVSLQHRAFRGEL